MAEGNSGGKPAGEQTRGYRNLAVNFLCQRKFFKRGTTKVAARLGIEPRQNESESFVLPLHHRAGKAWQNAMTGHRSGPEIGAGDGIRTRNRLFTKQVLYH